jgi:hypothetical protein
MNKLHKNGDRKRNHKKSAKTAGRGTERRLREHGETLVFDPVEMANNLVSFFTDLKLFSKEVDLMLAWARQVGLGQDVVDAVSGLKEAVESAEVLVNVDATLWPDFQKLHEVAENMIRKMMTGNVNMEDQAIKKAMSDVLNSAQSHEEYLYDSQIGLQRFIDELGAWSLAMWGVRWNIEGAKERLLEYAEPIRRNAHSGQKVVHMQDFLRRTGKT